VKWILVGIISICTALGDVLNTAGMRRQVEVQELNVRSLGHLVVRVFRNPLVLGGLGALAASFFAFLSLLSISNVSFAVPATAISYVLETMLAKYVLKESVTWRRWAAASLVSCGVALFAFGN
jgi:drug/metabolite transporter (DMT)-like permease